MGNQLALWGIEPQAGVILVWDQVDLGRNSSEQPWKSLQIRFSVINPGE